MASAFGHAMAAIAIGKGFTLKDLNWKFWLLGIICSILPDADVIGFAFGIKYESFWGHRGFSHSLVFAGLLAVFVMLVFYRKEAIASVRWWLLWLYFVLATASHALLDGMTSGGLGVAFFSPFDNARYFLPWRPIKVSPIGVEKFFSEWGMRVIKSELLWIFVPCLAFILVMYVVKRVASLPADR